ncbi:50S ribosomal protein L25/general stress protein Ctc [Woodsholea maritima]|uniref:50S ribosomal protein L25/general stress protein Ctc n=1 Tax=Woodsholea maritima TaxID=240237 RepID=UPI00035D76AB|nr:50S ribosomal protein L25/general stress protein Ctc [Woodsholea maritima]
MSDIVLSVDVRETTGTGGARAARRDGLIPGVIYGGPRGSIAINLKRNELVKAINSGKFLSHMVTIDHNGEKQPVIARDVQFHPVTDQPMHVDLLRVEEGEIISVEVVVHFANEEKSPGLKRGGVLNVVRHTVELDCPADKIPEEIVVDLSGAEIGDTIHISSVTLPEGTATTIKDRDFTVATIQGSRAATEAATSEEDGEAEE